MRRGAFDANGHWKTMAICHGHDLGIKNFPLVVAQISCSVTHMSVDAITGACGYVRRAATADRFGQHKGVYRDESGGITPALALA